MRSFLSVLLPPFCIQCGFIGVYICSTCLKNISVIKTNKCFYCGKGSALGLTHIICKKRWGVDGAISFYKYNNTFRKILITAKYQKAHRVLFHLLFSINPTLYTTIWKWTGLFSPIITAVPLHPQREQERGFNQSEIVAKHLAGILKCEYKPLLKREKNTQHLANISDKQKRKRATKGAFSFIETTKLDSVIIVDDVITSGATINECAATLKDNGVRNVLAFSLAK